MIRRKGLHSDGEFGDPTTVARARCFCGGSMWLLLTGFSLHSIVYVWFVLSTDYWNAGLLLLWAESMVFN